MSDAYGFRKVKPATPAAPEVRKLDLGGLPDAPPPVTSAQETAVNATSERLGFVDREPMRPGRPAAPPATTAVKRRRGAVPAKGLLIKGPNTVIDRFVSYANERGSRAYWELLDELLKAQNK